MLFLQLQMFTGTEELFIVGLIDVGLESGSRFNTEMLWRCKDKSTVHSLNSILNKINGPSGRIIQIWTGNNDGMSVSASGLFVLYKVLYFM